jgi:hypothetical protein
MAPRGIFQPRTQVGKWASTSAYDHRGLITAFVAIGAVAIMLFALSTAVRVIYDAAPAAPAAFAQHVATSERQPRCVSDADSVCVPRRELSRADVRERDYRVLYDPLFPPTNRSDTATHAALSDMVRRGGLYSSSDPRAQRDTYRLVAYVVNRSDPNRDVGGNTWKLFARERDRNRSEFYMSPSLYNTDLKIPVTDDMIAGNEKLRDVYSIPPELSFKSGLLNETPYEVVELPKLDLSTAAPEYI